MHSIDCLWFVFGLIKARLAVSHKKGVALVVFFTQGVWRNLTDRITKSPRGMVSSFLGYFTAVVDWIAMCGVNIMFLFFLSCGLSQFFLQEFACIRLLACCHFLRGTARDKVAALLATFGAKVNHIVGALYNIHVVLYDNK